MLIPPSCTDDGTVPCATIQLRLRPRQPHHFGILTDSEYLGRNLTSNDLTIEVRVVGELRSRYAGTSHYLRYHSSNTTRLTPHEGRPTFR